MSGFSRTDWTPKAGNVERAPKENRFEFVVIASARARQLLRGALPRENGDKKTTIAQREVLRRKVEKVDASADA